MADNLYGPAASLLKGAADTNTATMNRESETDLANKKLLQGGIDTMTESNDKRYATDQAMARQKVEGDQQMQVVDTQIAGRLKDAQAQAEQEKQRHDYENFFTVSPELAQGLYKSSGGRLDFRDKVGSRQPTSLVMALATGYSRVESSGERGKGKGANSLPPADKEFLKTYRGYQKDTENWNYETVKALADTDAKQAADLKRKLDFIETGKGRFGKLNGVKETPEDNTGTPKYGDAADVKAAFKAGTITQDQATQILRDQFGYGE